MEYITNIVEGLEIPLYYDWQNQKQYLGRGILTTYKSDGHTFIPESYEQDKVPKIFRYELWMVNVTSTSTIGEEKGYNVNTEYSFKVRAYVGEGNRFLREKEPNIGKTHSLRPDSFLTINGKQIY